MRRLLLPVLALSLATACSDSNNNTPAADDDTAAAPPPPPPSAVFEVRTVNLTVGQPLSPVAAVVHDDSFRAFTVGEPASAGLEVLAEAGANGDFLDEVDGRAEASGESPLGPGLSETLTLELDSDDTTGSFISVMTMLVNTNDAITGVNGVDVSNLEVGDTMRINAIVYDAGTEANTEVAGSIPGPADEGEGFNAARDDVADQVTMHGGVVTADDGLSSSVLNHNHRFDNPVARFIITRTQ